jgi:hypothetical protein
MNIQNINSLPIYSKIYETDENHRQINLYYLNNAIVCSDSFVYPNLLLKNNDSYINPINETIMSLKDINNKKINVKNNVNSVTTVQQPLFFFIYNTENYYHFIYDSLPYLISYFKIKQDIPSIKLLMSYPNSEKKEHYRFVLEFLDILGITEDNIELIQKNHLYKNLYISTSYTHDQKSNLPPRKEIFSLYSKIVENCLNKKIKNNDELPKNIYISRRTWLHNNFSNIGTNYTTRRFMSNETEIVDYLTKFGYSEIFTENLSTIEKINLFYNAKNIIGSIGGGICNVLFSKKSANLIAIESPGFLEVNNRFVYSLNNVNLRIFKDTQHIENTEFKKYMRVSYKDIVGEITNIDGNMITVSYLDEFVAGWNNERAYKILTIDKKYCKKLDNGLNSPWMVDLEKFKNYVK